jgi:polyisoprenoid-binding protein YceI
VAIETGSYQLGPGDGTLRVHTGRSGAAAKAGHDLVIEVSDWQATLEVGDGTRVELTADPASLRVIEGTGGIQALGDDDIAEIHKTIVGDVLGRDQIAFRSTAVEAGDGALTVQGDLTLNGATRQVSFDLHVADRRLQGTAVVTQTDFGIKPYSTLFGALKVADEVEVALDAGLPQLL